MTKNRWISFGWSSGGILNPKDEDDGAIISCISLPEEGKELERAEEFAERVALLLKHDWECVKLGQVRS